MSGTFHGLTEIFLNYGHLQISVHISCSLRIRSIIQPDRGVCKWFLLINDAENPQFEDRISHNEIMFLFINNITHVMTKATTKFKRFTAKGHNNYESELLKQYGSKYKLLWLTLAKQLLSSKKCHKTSRY